MYWIKYKLFYVLIHIVDPKLIGIFVGLVLFVFCPNYIGLIFFESMEKEFISSLIIYWNSETGMLELILVFYC